MGYRPQECLVCGHIGEWYVLRIGDAVVFWSCSDHLALVLEDQAQGRGPRQSFNVMRSNAPARTPE